MKLETVTKLIRPFSTFILGAVGAGVAVILMCKHEMKQAAGVSTMHFAPGIYTPSGEKITPLYLPGEIVFVGTAQGSGADGKLFGPHIVPVQFGETYRIDRETNAPREKTFQDIEAAFPIRTNRGEHQ